MKYHVIEIHPSDCITPSPPPVRVSAHFIPIGNVAQLVDMHSVALNTLWSDQEADVPSRARDDAAKSAGMLGGEGGESCLFNYCTCLTSSQDSVESSFHTSSGKHGLRTRQLIAYTDM